VTQPVVPTQPTKSFLEYVSLKLPAYFASLSPAIAATVLVGWRQRAKQINQGPGGANRIVFDDDTGRSGKFSAATQPGRNPRPLWNWERAIRMSVWAVDASDPSNELKQMTAAENLLEATLQGIHQVAYGQFHPLEITRTPSPIERVFGCEFLVTAELHSPVLDLGRPTVTPENVVVGKKLDGGST
jgi:hypothetical protein